MLISYLFFTKDVLCDIYEEDGVAYLYYYNNLMQKKRVRIPVRYLPETVLDKGFFKKSFWVTKFNTGKRTVVFEIYDATLKGKVASIIDKATFTP